MKHRSLGYQGFSCIALFLALIVAFVSGVLFRINTPLEIAVNYSLVYRLAIKNPSNHAISIADLAVKMPVGASYLHSNSKEFSESFEKNVDYFSVSSFVLPPYSQQRRLLTVEGQQTYPQIARELNKKFKRSLSTSSSEYQGILVDKTEDGVLQMFEWLEQKIEKIPYQQKALTLKELQEVWRGDCTEFTLMGYYALKNSGFTNVVPVVGFYYPDGASKVVDQNKFHAWLLVEYKGKWLVVDPLFKKIQEPSSEYLVVDVMNEGENEIIIRSSFNGIRLE